MLHRNGTSWTKAGSPDPLNAAMPGAVSAVSGSDARAAGCVRTSTKADRDRTVLLHWNGASWTRS